jgi:hypothetical protein
MQGANKEIRDNDDEDGHEFDEIVGLEEGVDEGLTEDQRSAKKKQKEADLLEAHRQRELAAT